MKRQLVYSTLRIESLWKCNESAPPESGLIRKHCHYISCACLSKHFDFLYDFTPISRSSAEMMVLLVILSVPKCNRKSVLYLSLSFFLHNLSNSGAQCPQYRLLGIFLLTSRLSYLFRVVFFYGFYC